MFHIGIKILKVEHSSGERSDGGDEGEEGGGGGGGQGGGLYCAPWGLYKVTVEKEGAVFEVEAEALLNGIDLTKPAN